MTEEFLMKCCGWLAVLMAAGILLGFILDFIQKGIRP
jgi:hypothetical protein